jgi:hypothetical protein
MVPFIRWRTYSKHSHTHTHTEMSEAESLPCPTLMRCVVCGYWSGDLSTTSCTYLVVCGRCKKANKCNPKAYPLPKSHIGHTLFCNLSRSKRVTVTCPFRNARGATNCDSYPVYRDSRGSVRCKEHASVCHKCQLFDPMRSKLCSRCDRCSTCCKPCITGCGRDGVRTLCGCIKRFAYICHDCSSSHLHSSFCYACQVQCSACGKTQKRSTRVHYDHLPTSHELYERVSSCDNCIPLLQSMFQDLVTDGNKHLADFMVEFIDKPQ